MPITVFASFKLNAPYTVKSEELQAFLKEITTSQQKATSYAPVVCVDDRDEGVIYTLGGYESSQAHIEFATKDENKHLGPQSQKYCSLQFNVELDLDYAVIPAGANILTYMKYVGYEPEPMGDVGQLWFGKTSSIANPAEVYQFSAFEDANLKRIAAVPDDCFIMKKLTL